MTRNGSCICRSTKRYPIQLFNPSSRATRVMAFDYKERCELSTEPSKSFSTTICHRYRLLPFTDSDLKKGRIPFFLEDSKCNVSLILNHIGNLLPVYMSHGPGKYIARMALGFSSTINSADASVVLLRSKPHVTPF